MTSFVQEKDVKTNEVDVEEGESGKPLIIQIIEDRITASQIRKSTRFSGHKKGKEEQGGGRMLEWSQVPVVADPSLKRSNRSSTPGLPDKRYGHSFFRIDEENVMLYAGLSGIYGFKPNVDVWTVNLVSQQWTHQETPLPHPRARYNHSTVMMGGDICVFGGHSGYHELNDTWFFSLAKGKWSRFGVDGKMACPAPRQLHAAAHCYNRMMVFGGLQEDPQGRGKRISASELFDDLWIFDPETGYWTLVEPTTDLIPEPRYGHTLTSVGQRVFLFGGLSTEGLMNDVWELNTANLFWTKLDVNSVEPGARFGHCAVEYLQYLVVYGGEGSSLMSDVWAFDTTNHTWEQWFKAPEQEKKGKRAKKGSSVNVQEYPEEPECPSGRRSSAMIAMPEEHCLVMMGGTGKGGNSLGDLWVLDLDASGLYVQLEEAQMKEQKVQFEEEAMDPFEEQFDDDMHASENLGKFLAKVDEGMLDVFAELIQLQTKNVLQNLQYFVRASTAAMEESHHSLIKQVQDVQWQQKLQTELVNSTQETQTALWQDHHNTVQDIRHMMEQQTNSNSELTQHVFSTVKLIDGLRQDMINNGIRVTDGPIERQQETQRVVEQQGQSTSQGQGQGVVLSEERLEQLKMDILATEELHRTVRMIVDDQMKPLAHHNQQLVATVVEMQGKIQELEAAHAREKEQRQQLQGHVSDLIEWKQEMEVSHLAQMERIMQAQQQLERQQAAVNDKLAEQQETQRSLVERQAQKDLDRTTFASPEKRVYQQASKPKVDTMEGLGSPSASSSSSSESTMSVNRSNKTMNLPPGVENVQDLVGQPCDTIATVLRDANPEFDVITTHYQSRFVSSTSPTLIRLVHDDEDLVKAIVRK